MHYLPPSQAIEASDALVIGQSSAVQARYATLFLAFAAVTAVVATLVEPARPVLLIVFTALVFIAVSGAFTAWKARHRSWEIRLDHDGVTVRGDALIPWWHFTSIDITDYRPRLFCWLLGWKVVAFIPVMRGTAPLLPSHRTRTARSQYRSWDRWYGSRLLIFPATMDTSMPDIIAAVRRFSDVPITGDGR